ncbi:hypothetical protein EMIHUDRAFT_236561 [Emiliania huxleyi CCMP1516]|uniref:Uncharacterized protein n=2 Tax=Emiliania huxleyi TaxID=2903 RepID=A0A0D3JTB8_EMIH1|nr:hypothetical protein EMIHUDRAFT_236561 [Emiliania huxleyi CCMP1516]EOD26753.1 hypothetical protein EMIHUDRAFT_236561 [Emiliania huxleyi CCMP1516]|eukprot:XP_005779182.1 hypothetical protein EMIHUDRAFT_236561 [Emiliania huxleyi CCMP1516]
MLERTSTAGLSQTALELNALSALRETATLRHAGCMPPPPVPAAMARALLHGGARGVGVSVPPPAARALVDSAAGVSTSMPATAPHAVASCAASPGSMAPQTVTSDGAGPSVPASAPRCEPRREPSQGVLHIGETSEAIAVPLSSLVDGLEPLGARSGFFRYAGTGRGAGRPDGRQTGHGSDRGATLGRLDSFCFVRGIARPSMWRAARVVRSFVAPAQVVGHSSGADFLAFFLKIEGFLI